MAVPFAATAGQLGQMLMARDIEQQRAMERERAMMLALQQQRAQYQEREAARAQQQSQFAQSLAQNQAYRAQQAEQYNLARQLQAQQFEQARQDSLRQQAAIGAERAISRADRATELRDYQDLQRELGMARITEQKDRDRRAISDQSYRMLMGVAGSDPGFDLETLNQRAGPEISLEQWEQLAHTGASREQQEAEARKSSEQAAAILNTRWKNRPVKSKDEAADWASFMQLRDIQPWLKLVAPDDTNFQFTPFGRSPGTSFRDWRDAAYGDAIAAGPTMPPPAPTGIVTGPVAAAVGAAPATRPAALPRLGRSALHTAIGSMAELNEEAIRHIANDLLSGRITPAEAQQRRAQIVASMAPAPVASPAPLATQLAVPLGPPLPPAPARPAPAWLEYMKESPIYKMFGDHF